MRAFVDLAAQLSGVSESRAAAAAAVLLASDRAASERTARSLLNNDGAPLQICVTLREDSRAVRLIGDPGAWAETPEQRLAAGRGGGSTRGLAGRSSSGRAAPGRARRRGCRASMSTSRRPSPRPMLLYRAACPKCRLSSALVVALSLGWIARIPAQSPDAAGLYARFGQPPGHLALIYRDAFCVGWTMPAWALLALVENLALGRWVRLGPFRSGWRSERSSG